MQLHIGHVVLELFRQPSRPIILNNLKKLVMLVSTPTARYHALHEVGTPWTVEKTWANITMQLHLASFGVEKPISDLQMETGIKDKVASHWIEKLLERARSLKSSNLAMTADEVLKQCVEWLATVTDEPYSCLLNVPS
ncbi:hypothetical protein JAAARDRAFT_194521 [Jaapia argillacea MUCL 33604]|uniref:Uncharacterized protein n=1 Tax=Jaapia argillacea MUCL 33604 TaxID=933084 RepID=A0A067Q1P4_9AGAM|nr:hypothetical protein JAAARDRAFT_194521 [Jaapia argillacea MUCL 33604]